MNNLSHATESSDGAAAGREPHGQATIQGRELPMGGSASLAAYATLASLFLVGTTSALLWLRRKKLVWPKPEPLDVALIAVGTARLSRLITRDKVMSPLRAPFVAAEAPAAGVIRERAKAGAGLVHAVGELITCPRCTAVWAASALSLTYLASPSAGRFVGTVLSSAMISDLANRSMALLDDWHPSRVDTRG